MSVINYTKQTLRLKGFTLVELVLVIVVLGILASAGSSFFSPLIKLFFYIPDQMRTQQIANRMAEVVIEGDNNAKGLRTAKMISVEANNYGFIRFLSADDKYVTLRWSPVSHTLIRTIETTSITTPVPPEYAAGTVLVDPLYFSRFFRYFNYLNNEVSPPTGTRIYNLGRIELDWQVRTNTTLYRLNTGVDTKMR